MILAHGIGSRGDLPVPFELALNAAIAALVFSFVILGYAWRTPRWADGEESGRPLPAGLTRLVDSRGFRLLLRGVGLLATAYVAVAALFGPDRLVNPTIGVVYVLFWIGLVPASLLFGPVWRLLNPLRAIHRVIAWTLRTPPEQGLLRLPERLGYWPAVAGLLAFVWLELIAPGNTTLPVIRLWFAVYAVVHLMAATLYGSRWFDKGDAFEVYSGFFGRLSPLGRRRSDGRLVLRNPLANLAGVRIAPGLVAVIAVMLGSTGFDGFSQSPWWTRLVQSGDVPGRLVGTLALLVFVLFVAVTFVVATAMAGGLAGRPGRDEDLPSPDAAETADRDGGEPGGAFATGPDDGAAPEDGTAGEPARESAAVLARTQERTTEPASAGATGAGRTGWDRALPGRFAASVVPIALGYVIAHYFTLFVVEGQRTLILLSDPLNSGANLLGLTDNGVSAGIAADAGIVALIKVTAVVVGHVLGVIAAHDKAVELFPRRTVLLAQLPLLIVMIVYTVGGLTLLFAT